MGSGARGTMLPGGGIVPIEGKAIIKHTNNIAYCDTVDIVAGTLLTPIP